MKNDKWEFNTVKKNNVVEIYHNGKSSQLITIDHLIHLYVSVDQGFKEGLFENSNLNNDSDILNKYFIRPKQRD